MDKQDLQAEESWQQNSYFFKQVQGQKAKRKMDGSRKMV